MTNPLILFLGNRILADDRIGLNIGEMLKGTLEAEGRDVEIIEESGFSLIDYLEGRENVTIVDSVRTGLHEVGEVVILGHDDFQRLSPFASHYGGIPEALALMRQLDLQVPSTLRLIGIEVEEPYVVSTKMCDKLEMEVTRIADEIHTAVSGQSAASSRYSPDRNFGVSPG